jgi:UMF1 family MFS transporter
MMVLHADPARPAESFGLYALSGKAMSFVSPALVAAATAWSGSQQAGIVPIIAMLALGLAWFLRVNPRGERG